jgi:hypothetical protein
MTVLELWNMQEIILNCVPLVVEAVNGFGGWTSGSERSQKQAAAFAQRMRPIMSELATLSAHQAAAELNRRKIVSATGRKWYAATVIRLCERLGLF